MSTASPADLAALTAALVDIPSPTGGEARLADWLEFRLAGRRPVRRVGDTLLSPGPDDGRPVVTLVGHTDTVPAQGNDRARMEAGRVHGLGATDMKGGLAVMLALAESVPAEAPVGLGLCFYPGEEGPMSGNPLGPLLADGSFPPSDLAIVLEPTDGSVQLGCLGTLNVTVTFRGESAHSARPWLGRNAIHMGAKLLAQLADRPPRKVLVGNSMVYREVISATLAQGGSARNVVPAEFKINLNARFAPGRTVESAEAEVKELVTKAGGEMEVVDRAPAGPLCSGNLLLQRLVAAGLAVEPKQAWTDVAQLGAAGIDAINYGPGETALAHRADESVGIDALGRCYDTLYGLLTTTL